jgi:hypothetical protein
MPQSVGGTQPNPTQQFIHSFPRVTRSSMSRSADGFQFWHAQIGGYSHGWHQPKAQTTPFGVASFVGVLIREKKSEKPLHSFQMTIINFLGIRHVDKTSTGQNIHLANGWTKHPLSYEWRMGKTPIDGESNRLVSIINNYLILFLNDL